MRLAVAGIVAALSLYSTAPAHAASFTDSGNSLLIGCEEDGTFASNACSVFISGVAEGIVVGLGRAHAKQEFCYPAGSTNGQAMDVVLSYLRQHPENRQLPASLLISFALDAAWPCPQQ